MTAPDPVLLIMVDAAVRARNARREGQEWRFQCPQPEHHQNADAHPSARWNPSEGTWYCDVGKTGGGTLDLARRLGIESKGRRRPERMIVANYDYTDAEGHLLFQVVRFEPGKNGKKKDFAQRRPDGKGGWTWGAKGVPDVLYRLPEVLAAKEKGETIYIVEGEKDADRLRGSGLVATTNRGGAGKWRSLLTEQLRGANVVILPDNDRPGEDHANQVAASLAGVAASIRAVRLPGLSPKEDVSDYLEGTGTAESLRALVEAAPEWMPSEKSPHSMAAPGDADGEGDGELRTDLGNARRLVRLHGSNLRFCPALGWLVWDGRRWARDETGGAMRKAKATVRTIWDEAKRAPSPEEAEALGKWAVRSQGVARLEAMLHLAATEVEIVVTPDRLDADPWALNVQNGTIDLRTGELHPHRSEDLITRIVPVAYDPAATAPRWESFLSEVQPHAEIRAYLRRLSGASLSGRRREHVLPIFFGTGGNGKSVFTLLWFFILGEYAKKVQAETFAARDRKSASNDLAALAGARLVLASEPESGARLAESLVKDMTGGDPVTCRFLYHEFFTYTPQFVPVLVTNHRPHVQGGDFGIWRRIALVPWTVQIAGTKGEDPKLSETLKAEAPGILAWSVAGCLEWQRDGLRPPAAVAAATRDYRENEDVLGPFLDDRCVLGDALSVTSSALWAEYRKWVEGVGEKPMSRRAFGDRLLDRGYQPTRSGKGRTRGWEGVTLADAADASRPIPRNFSREGEKGEVPGADASGVRPASAAPPRTTSTVSATGNPVAPPRSSAPAPALAPASLVPSQPRWDAAGHLLPEEGAP